MAKAKREHLTDKRVSALLSNPTKNLPTDLLASFTAGNRVEVWHDDPVGLGLRVAPPVVEGTRARGTWQIMYRNSERRQRRLRLGTYPTVGLADARTMAISALRQVELGDDPAGAKTESRKRPTFEHVAAQYLERYAKREKKSWKKDEQAINNELVPVLGKRVADEIESHEIATMLAGIRDRGAGVWANRVLEIVRRIYSWGMEPEQRLVTRNPASGLRKPAVEKADDRWLKGHEIKILWPHLSKHGAAGDILSLMLLTGQRPGEVRTMRLRDIDLGSGWWTIPGDIAKNEHGHAVALNDAAKAIVERVTAATKARIAERQEKAKTEADKAEWLDQDWLFPKKGGRGPIDPSFATDPMKEILAATKLPHFTADDLRATCATHLGSEPLSFDEVTIAKVLNHANKAITARYVRHSYAKEKRLAMEAWGSRLEAILTGKTSGKVVKMTAA